LDHDLIGNPRVVAAKIDLGVYESQNTATKKIFVKQGASGDGNSWASAMGDLQHAINASCAGDTIFVAAGTYKPQAKPTNPTENTPDHRDNAFSMKSFVAVYGGFKGTEKNLSERILPAVSGSILSGDFNGNDVITGTGFGLTISGNDENAYHVIAAVGVGALVIDGFVIQGGNASSDSEVNIKNNAIGRRNGGGILIESVDDVSIANCTIRYNKAVAIGAGIAAHWSTNVKIKNSTLTLNRANDGGALRMRGITGEIENTLITLNVASADGGGIYLSEKSSVLNITDTRISSNFAGADGGGGRISASTLRISGGNLNENRAENGAGGALFSRTNALIVINDATISNNYCKDNGGGIWNGGSGGESASQVYLTKVQMKGNIAGDKGGALYNYRASGEETAVLNHVEISANQAVYGGGIANSGNDASMVYSTTANHIFNSVISRNKASKDGGGIYNEKSNRSLLLNVTVANNEAKYGGGIYNNSEKCPPIPESDYYQCDDDKSSAYVQNSIVWGNQATGGAGIYEGSGRYVSDKRYSLVQGISSTAKGNLDASMTTPGFTDEANGDYSLKPGSSVINAGDNSLLSTSLQFDFLGNSRFAQFIVDMGAIEFQQNTTKHPIRYVKVGAAGAGTSWDDASGDLQAMINAPDVVQVWVTSGTYLSSGDGFFLKNNVAIYGGFPNSGNPAMSSRNWQQTPSILSGGNTRRVVFNNFPSGSPLTPTAILDGFVITEGNTGGNGGGMYNVNASPRLIHITFSNNKSTGSGGAMYNATSQPEITYTKFVNNTAGGNGGAIGNTSTSAPFILNCLFSGNSASSGGALSADNGSSYRLMNSTIAGNSASASGGGVYHAGSTTSPSIYSSIVYGNGTQIRNENQATAVTSYSVVEGGYTGTGNINANPKFVNSTASDYRLQADSPAINAGDTEAYGNLGRDLENDLDLNSSLRVFNELIDIGAYEFNGAAVFSTRYVKENGGGNGSSWATASGNLQAMINEEGVDEVWVAKGTYTSSGNGFKLKNNVAVYGGFSNVGNPGIEERDWVRNVTILSGGTQRRVFYNDFTPSKPLNNTSILDGFTITAGKGGNGAAMYNANAAPRLVHLTFLNNQSTGNGGAVYNAASAPFILNCRFKNNVASGNGGALCNASVSRPLLVNTVFSGNSASSGGAVYANNGSSYTMINSTITGNTDGVTHAGSTTLPKIHNSIIYATGVAIQNQSSAVTTVSYSFVEGGFSGIGNVDAAPEFENEAGGDYQLKPTSPAINGGSNVLLSGLVEDADQNTDVDGNFRIYDSSEGGAIDMGAFEFQGNPVYPAIRYVKAGAKGSGYSWGSASGDLQSAIDAPDVEQVWVAAGTYTPQSIVGTSDDERDKSFVLQNDVMIYGGFRGTEATLADRPTDFTLHRSILSGDLYQDDVQGNIQGINTYHVVISVNDVGTAELNGFTVRGGYTGKSGSGNVSLYGRSVSRERGGGISLVASSPKITNVIISGNIGYAGGAIANSAGSTPSLRNVLISDNTGDYGGGIYNNASSPVFINVTVARNKAIETNDQGVALRNVSNSYPKIFNSIIHGNTNVDGFVNNIFNSGGVTPTSIPEYMYSLVQGSNAGWSSFGTNGGHNIDGEPQFINSPEGDYRLLSNSAAVNGGNNGYTIAGDNTLTVDLMGNPRIQNGIIDMGAFEMACSSGLSESVVFTRKEISEGVNRFTAGCYYLATLVGEGDHQVSGFVSATSRLAPQNVISQQTARFVRRFYQLTAETNSAHATARVTLYFTKQDFKAYNDGYGQEAGFLLPVNPEDVVNTLKIVQYHGEGGEDGMPASPSATHSILNPSSVTWNSSQELWEITFSISGFSSFFITTQSNPLPVTLVDFTAKSVEQNVELTWHTTSEVDASHFEIEKSGNGKTWETLGTVDAHGAAAGNYAYTDASRLYNINYYRLKMVDMDGSYSYSRMVSVHNRDNARQMQVSIYPNPVSAGILTVSTSQAGTPVVTVYDLLGRKVKVPILKNIEGELGLDVSRLSAGIYIISVRKEEEEQVLRFVVH
jgi:predicted outer membrane repeat protein